MTEQVMPGGRSGGAIRLGDTVLRPAKPWTATVHTVLRHLETAGFSDAPRVIDTDAEGNDVQTYLPGTTVGDTLPWPAWVHSDTALFQVGTWLRRLHDATADFVPPADAVWFAGQQWRPGLVIGHHDAAPYNAVWQDDRLAGFIDWETAGPSSRAFDLAWTALSWVPLHPGKIVEPRGFTALADRSRRLHLLLDAYGYDGDRATFGAQIAARARVNCQVIRTLAATGQPTYVALLPTAADLEHAAHDIEQLPATFWTTPAGSKRST
jgi:hypothetical protein